MLFLLVLAVGVLTVRVAGGSFAALAQLQVRGAGLLAGALCLQITTISVLRNPPHHLAASLHLASYAIAGTFLWLNRRLPGLPLTAAGGALNALVIAANGGTMPATAAALQAAGVTQDAHHFANSAAVPDPQMALLGDVFAIPRALGPLANVFSLGDVTLALGALWLLYAAAGCRMPRTPEGDPGRPA